MNKLSSFTYRANIAHIYAVVRNKKFYDRFTEASGNHMLQDVSKFTVPISTNLKFSKRSQKLAYLRLPWRFLQV